MSIKPSQPREGAPSDPVIPALQHVAREKRWLIVVGVAFGSVALVSLLTVLVSGPRQPTYKGVPLSKWLDGRRGIEMFDALKSVGPDALPWLVQAAEGNSRIEYVFYRHYSKLYNSSSIVRRLLPKPGRDLSSVAHYNTLSLLSRLAPGTEYEERALSAIMRPRLPRLQKLRPGILEVRCGLLAQFTNHPAKVLPILLLALTNAGTVDSAVSAFQRFGTSATPVLYPRALSETGFIRPAELALKKADPAAHERLLAQKSGPEKAVQNGTPAKPSSSRIGPLYPHFVMNAVLGPTNWPNATPVEPGLKVVPTRPMNQSPRP
jgi:hypothetical protein